MCTLLIPLCLSHVDCMIFNTLVGMYCTVPMDAGYYIFSDVLKETNAQIQAESNGKQQLKAAESGFNPAKGSEKS